MSAPSRVRIRQRRRELAWSRAAVVFAVFAVALGGYLFARITHLNSNQDTLNDRLDRVTILAGQNQVAAGTNSIGPPAKSVAAGKAKPPPQEIAPTSPTSTSTVRPATTHLTAAQENHIAGMVLARVKVPHPTTADLSRAIVAVLKAHPSLTLTQVTGAVSAYEQKHPPAPGSPGLKGDMGLPGSVGPSGLPGVGLTAISATEDTSTDPPTVTFHFTLTDGTSTDVGPLDLPVGPAGPAGKDAPTLTGHQITNRGDGTCIDTEFLSDGSSYDSNPYACSPPPTTEPPSSDAPSASLIP